MKLVGFVVLGLVVTIALYFLIGSVIEIYSPSGPEVTTKTIIIYYLIVIPIAMLSGSILTGYLSYSRIKNRCKLMILAPGLYLAGLFIVQNLLPPDTVSVLTFGLYWYVVSLAGVGLGYFLRSRIRHHSLLGRADQ